MNPATLQCQLQLPYRRETWNVLLPSIFPGQVEAFQQPVVFPLASESHRAIAAGLRQTGRCLIPDDQGSEKILAIFELDVAAKVDLLRNRVALRQIVARCIDEVSAHAVLAFFVQPGKHPYRLTFATRESTLNAETLAIETRETGTRRFTYLLGPNEPRRTAAMRLSGLAAKRELASLKDVADAFSVDLLNDEFFDAYKDHYRKFCAHLLDGDAPTGIFGIKLKGLDEKARDRALKPVRDFVKKLLGRLVFLHFLQKKGWLGCPPDTANWKNGESDFLLKLFSECPPRELERFHSRRLVPLFFDTLNRQRKGDIFAITGKRVPYLNGGLFERDFEGVEKIDFPPELFSDLFDFFSQYNFTIDENDPDDREIGIDPEMLGHIFENLLEDNKDKGAYYTPKPVVQYMCQQSLIQALAGHFPGDAAARSAIDDLILYKEPIDPKRDSWLAVHATEIEKILDGLNICDPAIGSGAFPIGLLQEIFWTKLTLHPAMKKAQAKRNIIQRSIHGVDLDAGAVEIARLRFWLALIVDEDEPLPLPNLDYQIMQGNSLLESFEGIDLSRISEPKRIGVTLLGSDQGELGFSSQTMELSVSSEPQGKLEDLQQKYFACHDSESKARLRSQIDDAILRAIDFELEARRETLAAALDNWKRSLAQKRKINKRCEPTPKELKSRDAMQAELDALAAKTAKLHALLMNPTAERPFFLWHLWFRQIFSVGGFDIVIGNPPYVRADNPDFMGQRQAILADGGFVTLWEKWDLFVPFIEHGHRLLRPGGVEAMIVSDAYCHSKYAIKSQDWFLKNAVVSRLDFLGKLQIFDAGVKNMIFFYQRGDGANNLPERRLHTGRFGNVQMLPSERQADATHRLYFLEDQSPTLETFSIKTMPLDSICYITKGMVVHADEDLARGAFTLSDLVSDASDKIHSARFVEAKMLDRWSAAKHKWLEWGTKRAPSLFSRPTFPEIYSSPEKLISIDLAAGVDQLKVAYDSAQLYHNHSAWSFVPWHYLKNVRNRSLKKSARYPNEAKGGSDLPNRTELETLSKQFDAKYLVAVMNSKVARRFLMEHRRSNIHLFPDDWKKLPIPVATPAEQSTLTALVDSILAAKRAGHEAAVPPLEQEIDAHVFRLYGLTQEEIAIVEGATR